MATEGVGKWRVVKKSGVGFPHGDSATDALGKSGYTHAIITGSVGRFIYYVIDFK